MEFHKKKGVQNFPILRHLGTCLLIKSQTKVHGQRNLFNLEATYKVYISMRSDSLVACWI